MPIRRRAFLAGLAGAPLALTSLGAARARAIGERSQVGIGQLRHGGTWDSRPEALRRLLWETGKRTSIHVARDAAVVSADDEELFWQPLLVLTGEGAFPALTESQRARLARHLRFGGMLWIDAPSPGDAFADSARREVAALLPKEELKPLDKEHVLFKSYFLQDGAVGRTTDERRVFGASLSDRLAVLVTECDVLGAYERDRFGTWRFECVPDGERQRERAFRFGVNVMMYATCLDYKADQVHIPFIMKKTRR